MAVTMRNTVVVPLLLTASTLTFAFRATPLSGKLGAIDAGLDTEALLQDDANASLGSEAFLQESATDTDPHIQGFGILGHIGRNLRKRHPHINLGRWKPQGKLGIKAPPTKLVGRTVPLQHDTPSSTILRRNVHLMLKRKTEILKALLLRHEATSGTNLGDVTLAHGVSKISANTIIRGSAHLGGVFPDLLIDRKSMQFLEDLAKYILMGLAKHSPDFSKAPSNRELVSIGKRAAAYANKLDQDPSLRDDLERDMGTLGEMPGPKDLSGIMMVLRAFQIGMRQQLFKVGYKDVIDFGTKDVLLANSRKKNLPVPLWYWLRWNTGDCRLHSASVSLMLRVLSPNAVSNVRYTYAIAPQQEHWRPMADHAFVVYRAKLGPEEVKTFGSETLDVIADTYNRRLDGRVVKFSEDGKHLEITPHRLVQSKENTWFLDKLPTEVSDATTERALAQMAMEELWSRDVPKDLRLDLLPYPQITNHDPGSLIDVNLHSSVAMVRGGADWVEQGEWQRPLLAEEQCTEHSQCRDGVCMEFGACGNCGKMIVKDLSGAGRADIEYDAVPSTAGTLILGSGAKDLFRAVLQKAVLQRFSVLDGWIGLVVARILRNGTSSQLWQRSNGDVLFFDEGTGNYAIVRGGASLGDSVDVEVMSLKSTPNQLMHLFRTNVLFATMGVNSNSEVRQVSLQCQASQEMSFGACPYLKMELLGWRPNSVPYEKLSMQHAYVKRGFDAPKINRPWEDSVLWHVHEIVESMTDGRVLLTRKSDGIYEMCTTNRYAVRLKQRDFWQSSDKLRDGEMYADSDEWAFDRFTGKRWVLDVKGAVTDSARAVGLFEAESVLWKDGGSVFWLDDDSEDVVHTPVFRLKCLDETPPLWPKRQKMADDCVNSWSALTRNLHDAWKQ